MDSQSSAVGYDTVDIREPIEPSEKSSEIRTDSNRGPRGRRGPPGPPIESCIVILKPEHPEYFIRNEADVAIIAGNSIWPKIHLPKIESKQEFDCEYLTAYTTKSRLKIINQSTSILTITPAPGDKFHKSDRKYQIMNGETALFYGIGDRWYVDHQIKVYRSG